MSDPRIIDVPAPFVSTQRHRCPTCGGLALGDWCARCDPRFAAVSNEIARILTAWDEDPDNGSRPWYSLSTDDIADLATLAALSAMPTREKP